jgi:hypothetical protein
VLALSDGAGPVSETERCTRGTSVVKLLDVLTGSNLADMARGAVRTCQWVWWGTPEPVVAFREGGRGECLRRTRRRYRGGKAGRLLRRMVSSERGNGFGSLLQPCRPGRNLQDRRIVG